MPKFEAELLYSADHKGTLQTYADSMGWVVQAGPREDVVLYTAENDDEDYMLQDVDQAVGFYLTHEDIRPISWRIIRVIRDDNAGIDEITDEGED